MRLCNNNAVDISKCACSTLPNAHCFWYHAIHDDDVGDKLAAQKRNGHALHIFDDFDGEVSVVYHLCVLFELLKRFSFFVVVCMLNVLRVSFQLLIFDPN